MSDHTLLVMILIFLTAPAVFRAVLEVALLIFTAYDRCQAADREYHEKERRANWWREMHQKALREKDWREKDWREWPKREQPR